MIIKVKGVIVSNDDQWIYEWFDVESTSPRNIEEQLAIANGENIEVEIDSPGGDVVAGSAIYTMLKEYAGNVLIKIVSWAASAASVIAMAGDKIMISPTAQIMIHNVWSNAVGDYREHEHAAEILKGWNKSIANAYMLKTGMSQDELLELMNNETWLTAQDAIKYKFADEIMFNEGMQLAASLQGTLLPREVINKMRTLLANGADKLETVLKLSEDQMKDLLDAVKGGTQPQKTEPEAPRQVPVDLYTKLYENLERRAKV